jgi:hypothetical protein
VGLRFPIAIALLTGAVAYYASRPTQPVVRIDDRSAEDGKRLPLSVAQVAMLTGPAGEHPVSSILNVRKRMKYGEFVWDEAGIPAGPVWVRIDLGKQLISVFRAGQEIGTAVILYGADEKPTPTGQLAVLEKLKDHRSGTYDAPMPYTMRLTQDGVAIHGSDVRWGAATHGCVGVPLGFAGKLFGQIKVGDPVVILPAGSTPGAS